MEQVKFQKIVVLCDSSSALFSLISPRPETEDIIAEILALLHRFKLASVTVHFCWIPAHVCIAGNEVVDKLAKEALKRSGVDMLIPIGKSGAKALVLNNWQDSWNYSHTGRWL